MTEPSSWIDPQRQDQARAYARQRRRLSMLDLLVGAVFIAAWVIFEWGSSLTATIEGIAPLAKQSWWIELLAVAILLGLGWQLLTLPIEFYSDYILPHRYKQSTQSLSGWVTDLFKSAGIAIALILPLLLGLYWLMHTFQSSWWLWAGGLFSLVTVVLATLAPVLLMPIFFHVQPIGEDHQELIQRLTNLAQKAGADVQGVFSIDLSSRTRAANAALTGLGRTRRILLGDTLLEQFSADEIETVLAHELGHHVHKDIPLQILVQTGINIGGFYLAFRLLQSTYSQMNLSHPADPAGLPLLVALFGLIGLILTPGTNAFSRWRENLADAYALQATRKPLAFASAMTRLANQNLAELDPAAWVVWLLYSHPPLRERIRRAQRFHQAEGDDR